MVKKTVGRTYDIHFRLPVIQKLQIWQESKGYHHNDRGNRPLQEVRPVWEPLLVDLDPLEPVQVYTATK